MTTSFELCRHCGTTLHDPERDIFKEDSLKHECVPMLRQQNNKLCNALRAIAGDIPWPDNEMGFVDLACSVLSQKERDDGS